MPGGGQVGLAAPPPPPPPDPEPIVVMVGNENVASIQVKAAGSPMTVTAEFDASARSDHAIVRFERDVDNAQKRPWTTASASSIRETLRLVVMRLLVERALAGLPIPIGPGG